MVLFKALTGTVEFLQSILKMPFRLAEFVYHAIKGNEVDVVGGNDAASSSTVLLETTALDPR